MFGQSDDKKHDDKYKVGNGPMNSPDFSRAVNDLTASNNDGVTVGPAPSPSPQPQSSAPPNWGHPGAPIHNPSAAQHHQPDPTPPTPPSHDPSPNPVSDNHSSSHQSPDDLINIKQKALSELSPLVEHLDQTPEEKFHTIMMMIQASDDQSLLGAAHDAAGQIQDEKLRAQALLDVVNEINYFTQQAKN